MEVQPGQGLKGGRFLFPLTIMGLCLVVYARSSLMDLLVYNRQAVLGGELWRLLTGHLVHFSLSHLILNMLGFSLAVWIAWQRRCEHLVLLTFLAACFIGVAILLGQPNMAVYGGMSGLVNAVMVYVACLGLWVRGRWRSLSWTLLVLCLGTVIYEAATGRPALAVSDAIPFVPAPLAHIVGGMTGAFLALWEKSFLGVRVKVPV